MRKFHRELYKTGALPLQSLLSTWKLRSISLNSIANSTGKYTLNKISRNSDYNLYMDLKVSMVNKDKCQVERHCTRTVSSNVIQYMCSYKSLCYEKLQNKNHMVYGKNGAQSSLGVGCGIILLIRH